MPTFQDLVKGKGVIDFRPYLLYLINSGAYAALNPFLSIILDDRGLDEFQIGIVLAVTPLVNFIGSPSGGYLYDLSNESKLVWILFIIMGASVIQLLLATENFYFIICICALWSFALSPIDSILNHAVLTHLGENKKDYGKHRLWGAVSWGIVSFIMGILLTYFTIYISFISYFVGLICYCWFIYITKIPKVSAVPIDIETTLESLVEENYEPNIEILQKESFEHVHIDENIEPEQVVDEINIEEEIPKEIDEIDEPKPDIWKSLLKVKVIIFYILVFIMGVATTVIYGYLFLYIDDLGGSETLMGISLVCTVATEIPFFFYSGKFLELFGEEFLILSAMVAYVIRVLGYSILQNPWWVLPLELLHGLTFGAMYAAGIHYSSNLFPAKLSTTGQGIFNGIYAGLGPFCGGLLGGWLYDSYGPRTMFRILALFTSFGIILLICTYWKELYSKMSILFRNIYKVPLNNDTTTEEIELEELDEQKN